MKMIDFFCTNFKAHKTIQENQNKINYRKRKNNKIILFENAKKTMPCATRPVKKRQTRTNSQRIYDQILSFCLCLALGSYSQNY